jgi:hypothetical protein
MRVLLDEEKTATPTALKRDLHRHDLGVVGVRPRDQSVRALAET